MPRKRGNPNWGSGQQPRIAPAAAAEFEWKLQELGLTNETCVSSVQLRTLVRTKQESPLHPGMAAENVADAGRSRPQQRSLRTRTGGLEPSRPLP
jgi:hypothetical protein